MMQLGKADIPEAPPAVPLAESQPGLALELSGEAQRIPEWPLQQCPHYPRPVAQRWWWWFGQW